MGPRSSFYSFSSPWLRVLFLHFDEPPPYGIVYPKGAATLERLSPTTSSAPSRLGLDQLTPFGWHVIFSAC